MNNTNEIWKPIMGYEGCYEISNKGEVRSLSRTKKGVRYGKPYEYQTKEMQLKQHVDCKGYLRVKLQKDGNKETCKVHRLVAQTFLGDITDKEIDHINTIKTDNRVENLKIVSSKENSNNPITKMKKAEGHCKKVKCITPYGEVYVFNSITEAENKGYGKGCSISKCCNGKMKTYHNNRWEFIKR